MSPLLVLRSAFTIATLAAIGLMAGAVARSHSGGVKVTGSVDMESIPWATGGMAVGAGRRVPVLRIFGDYECPACRGLERAAGDTLRALARRGHIRFVYHHAPLRGHRRGPDAAAVAYCAGETGAPWPVHRALYESAPDWGNGPDGEGRLLAAAAAGLAGAGFRMADTAGLRACANSASVVERVRADRAAADALGIDAVPTIYFGDQRLTVTSWRALVHFVTARAVSP